MDRAADFFVEQDVFNKLLYSVIGADADLGASPCPQVRGIYARRLAEVETEIARLSSQRERMRRLLRRWQRLPDCAPTGESLCHLIDEATGTRVPGECCHE